MAVHALAIDGCAADHDIVDDGEAAFASYPIALAVLDPTVGQDCSLVKLHTSVVELFSDGNFIWVEEVPDRSVDDFIRRVSQNVNDGVRGVEDMGLIGEICPNRSEILRTMQDTPSVPWIVMKVVSMMAKREDKWLLAREVAPTALVWLCRI